MVLTGLLEIPTCLYFIIIKNYDLNNSIVSFWTEHSIVSPSNRYATVTEGEALSVYPLAKALPSIQHPFPLPPLHIPSLPLSTLKLHDSQQFIGIIFIYTFPMDNRDFKISSRELQKEFLCNICFNEIQDCYITRCGHVYCKKCIFETINRHHRCPFCNVELAEADVFKNYHFNTLRKILEKEKSHAAEKYLEKVFEHEEATESLLLLPVEKALNENYKNTLLTYRQYTKELFENLTKGEEKKALEKHSNVNMKTSEQIIQDIHKVLIPHVSTSLVSPTLVSRPFNISFTISPTKTLSFTTPLSALTPISTLISQLQLLMKQHNIRLQYKQPNLQSAIKINSLEYKTSDVIGNNIELLWNKPITIEACAGMNVVRNVECFTYKWAEGRTTNYFSCKDCKVNWICEVCKDYCHEGHAVTEHLKNQTPTWSCCYCVTKTNCRALNKNS